jgi:antitoxin component of RelBE/YafQ-DinJ toxin-antitoxin module
MDGATLQRANEIVNKEGFELKTLCRSFIQNIDKTGRCPLGFEHIAEAPSHSTPVSEAKEPESEESWNGIDRKLIERADEIYKTEGLDLYSVLKILFTKTVQEEAIPIRFNEKKTNN